MLELIKFPETSKVITFTNKTGTGARIMRPGEFKAVRKAQFPDETNKERKAAYESYRFTASSANTADLAAALTSGNIGVTRKVTHANGYEMTVKLIDKRHFDAPAAKPEMTIEQQLDQLDNVNKLAAYEQLKRMLFSSLSEQRMEASA